MPRGTFSTRTLASQVSYVHRPTHTEVLFVGPSVFFRTPTLPLMLIDNPKRFGPYSTPAEREAFAAAFIAAIS